MKITFLGTGTSQGIPMLLSDEPVNFSTDIKDFRMRSSAFIEWEGGNCLIDCGPDFRMQMLKHQIKSIDAILFTHEHSDHIAGLDDIRPYCYQQGPIPIYAIERVMNSLEKRYDYIFAKEDRYPGAASVIENIISDQPFYLKERLVIPIKVNHGWLDILGYRIKNLVYLTDVKTIDTPELEKLKNVDVLVVNALRIESHPTHFNLDEALEFINIIKPKKTYLIHISHRLGFHEEVSKILPENVFLAYDGLSVTI